MMNGTNITLQSNLDILKLMGLFFYKFKSLEVIWTCKKVSNARLWLEKAIKVCFLFRFEISEFEIWTFSTSINASKILNGTSRTDYDFYCFHGLWRRVQMFVSHESDVLFSQSPDTAAGVLTL